MAYFPDGSPYADPDEPNAMNVGWLDADHPFETVAPSTEFVTALAQACRVPVRRTRGLHRCELCPPSQFDEWPPAANVVRDMYGEFVVGGAEIRVRAADVVFAAPDMIFHYVQAHRYRPPEAFQAAVMAASSLLG